MRNHRLLALASLTLLALGGGAGGHTAWSEPLPGLGL
jgi:hypothetical protein